MPKQIKMELSVKSIDAAIKEVQKRREDFAKRVDALIDRMCSDGATYAINSITDHVYSGDTIASIRGYRNGNKGVIVAGGNAVWLEFGSGTIKNPGGGNHPQRQWLGMSPLGQYGVYGNGEEYPNGWWYEADDGTYKHTRGTEETMFMWKTAEYLKAQFPKLAKEVFK